ncbi:MAG: YciI family protein [Caldilineaceae bacterium]
MRYLLLIYTDETRDAQATPAQMEEMMGAYWAFTKELREAGKNLGGEALQPTSTATTVQVRNGKTVTTDGPFAENQGTTEGLLSDRCGESRRSHCLGGQDPRCPSRLD